MIFDEDLSVEEVRLIDRLQNKNRMEQDEIIGEVSNDTIRTDR